MNTGLPLSLTHAAASERLAELRIQARSSRQTHTAVLDAARRRLIGALPTLARPRTNAACPTC